MDTPQIAARARSNVREPDREVDLDASTFEIIPEVEAEEWQHDLPHVEPDAGADRVLPGRQVADPLVLHAGVRQVVPELGVRLLDVEEGDVVAVVEEEAAQRGAGDAEEGKRVLDVGAGLEVAAEL